MATTVPAIRPGQDDDTGDDEFFDAIDPATTVTAATIRARLVPPMPPRLVGWVGPLLITAFAGFLRFWHLGRPNSIMFDEVYYVHDSYDLLHYGVEHHDKACDGRAGFVVHPPLGKWMMSVGEWLFGLHGTCTPGKTEDKTTWHWVGAFGWRFSAALVGTLAVLILARTARRMTRSNLLGCVAGLLLACESLEFVQSRIGILDIFLMFWVVAAFACLVADRDTVRRRYADEVSDDGGGRWHATEPDGLGPRWWLIGAGVCTGAACAVKWNAAWFLPAFAALVLAWEIGARRTAGLKPYGRRVLDAVWWFVCGGVALAPVLVFGSTWPTSVGAGVLLVALWELAARRSEREPIRLLLRVGWGVCAALFLAGAFVTLHYGQTLRLNGGRRVTGPDQMHWAFFLGAIGLVAITMLGGLYSPAPSLSPARRGWHLPVAMGLVPVATYVATWTGWFVNSKFAYAHNDYVHPGMNPVSHAHAVFKGWLSYHLQGFWFHSHLYSHHDYASRPIGWIMDQRPVAYFYSGPKQGEDGCHVANCAREVMAVGHPLILWVSIPALAVLVWWWFGRRDWRAGAVLAVVIAGYFSWWPFSAYLPGTGAKPRTAFQFYLLDIVPFLVLALTLVIGLMIGDRDASPTRRMWGATAAGIYVAAVVALFAFFHPVLVADTLPKGEWDLRIWFPSWV